MYYSIRHLTKFLYKSPVSESIMETRMHPRSDAQQRCLTFHLSVSPRCRVFSYRDHLANHVHHFDIPGLHGQLVIVAESLVEMAPHTPVPESLPPGSWEELDRLVHEGDFWEMLLPSEFAQFTPELEALGEHLDLRRRDDPLSLLHKLVTAGRFPRRASLPPVLGGFLAELDVHAVASSARDSRIRCISMLPEATVDAWEYRQ